jgi:hypothetical protein
MKLCTLALGERYIRLSNRLRDSLPVRLEICTEIPADVAYRKSDGQYNHHNKRIVIERHYHPGGTLYLDADAICTDQSEFLAFLDSLAPLPAGIYSPYVFSSYGFKHPNMPDKTLDRTRLTDILSFVDSVIPLSDEDMLAFKMPYEWLMYFRFASPEQKIAFFLRYHDLHSIVMDSTCTLARDCNLIGLSAQYCRLPVVQLAKVMGVRHKK